MPPTRPTLVLALLAATLAPACSRGTEAEESPRLSGLKPRESTRVIVAPVIEREMVRRLETTTRVESRTQVSVFPRAAGVVVELSVEEGDLVEEGELLARLDDREQTLAENDARVALAEAKANLPKLEFATSEAEARMNSMERARDQAVRNHERNLAIADGADGIDLLSQRDLDESRLTRDQAEGDYQAARLAWERARLDEAAGATTVARAEITLEQASLALAYMRVSSPITGVVAQRMVRVGDTVSSAAAVFEVTDPNDLRTVFLRPQRELSLFQGKTEAPDDGTDQDSIGADLSVDVLAEALPGRNFRGTIERISPTIDPASGNFRVTARLDPVALDDPGARLLPGMLVRLSIVTERHPRALVVSKRAVRREGDRSVLFVVREGAAHAVAVEEGFTDDRDVEVSPLGDAVLEPGEPVVVVGNRDLEEGSPVSVEAPEAAAPEAVAAEELAVTGEASE